MNLLARGRASSNAGAAIGSSACSANRAVPSKTRRPWAEASGFLSLRMMEGDANAVGIGRLALAPDFKHAAVAVRDPPVGPDLVQALEHEPGRDDQGAGLGDDLGHHAERHDRQPFPRRVQGRDATAPQGVVLRHGIVSSAEGQVAHDPSSRLPFPDRPDPGAWLGDRSSRFGRQPCRVAPSK